jgi:site-specific recombinase XerD
MKTFTIYLLEKGFNHASIYTMTKCVERFDNYLKNQKLKPERCTYNDITGYIQYLAKKELSQRTIQHDIGVLKHYFSYLKTEDQTLINPIQHLNIKGVEREKIHDILPLEILEYMLENYPTEKHLLERIPLTASQHRNKLILSLFIYQGLTTTDLKQLRIENIELRQGCINIPESRKINPRKIKLNPNQILDLQEYMMIHREALIIESKEDTDKLIVSTKGGKHGVQNMLIYLQKEVKKLVPTLQDFKQIRASTIQRWLQQYGLRKTQYLAGHRFVSSTERYQKNDIEELQNELEKYGLTL